MANPWRGWSIKRCCGLALAFALLMKDWSPPGNVSHQDLGSVWGCRAAAGSLKPPNFPVLAVALLPSQACGRALELFSYPSPKDIRASSTCLCHTSQKSLLFYKGLMKSHLLANFTGMKPTNGLLQVLSQWLNYELLKNPFLCYL